MTEGKRNFIHQMLEEYDMKIAENIQEIPKNLLRATIKEIMKEEIDDHLGYEKS